MNRDQKFNQINHESRKKLNTMCSLIYVINRGELIKHEIKQHTYLALNSDGSY